MKHIFTKFTLLMMLFVLAVGCGSPEATPPPPAATAVTIQEEAATATEAPVATDEPVVEETIVEETTNEEDASMASDTDDFAGANEWTSAWMLNDGSTSEIFDGVLPNIASVSTTTVDGVEYQVITTSGIPDYSVTIDQHTHDALTTRPLASTDFGSGAPTVEVGDTVAFGQDIGYDGSEGCIEPLEGYGYWPNGPVCPEDVAKEQYFPLVPQPTDQFCATDLNSIGTWINGVSIFNYLDGQSYNSEGIWNHEALAFEIYDLDVCLGHAADGDYHNHSHPSCLQDSLGDDGSAASPIYGFAADGYPIYGPYEDAGVLANSCWVKRDYSADSPTGCGADGERTCMLVDQYDISLGTEEAESPGPNTDEYITSMSGNSILAASGAYFQDYYYDSDCTAQGSEYLDEHNGHYDEVRGYHYHTTLTLEDDGSTGFAFPHYAGPTYAGLLMDNALASCQSEDSSTGGRSGPPADGEGGEGGPPPEGEGEGEGEESGAMDDGGEEAAMVEVVSEQVEITLIDPLDGVTNSYCLDIAGGNQDVDPSNGLQAHTCYSYQGDLGSDQVFDTAVFANGTLYMPVYDVCAQVDSLAAGSAIGLAACDGSDLQSIVFNDDGTIRPTSASDLCFTAGSESRFGRSGDHQIRDLSLETCSAELASLQQWGARTGLDDDISIVAASDMTADAAASEQESHAEEGDHDDDHGERGGPPDLTAAAEALGISQDELLAALGGPPPDLAAAAVTLGITEAELEAAMGDAMGGGRPDATAGDDDADSAETETTESVAVDMSSCDTSNVEAQSADDNVEALRQAIVTFRASLSDELLADASACLGGERMYLWHNTPANDDNRNGITYGELTDDQVALFQTLLQAFLSDDGYQKVEEITFLSEGFLENQRAELWNPDFYSIDMFGDPENTGSWGFQLDGHHAAVNFLVHGDTVSIVPAFLGAEPVVGTLDGVDFDIFADERDMGLSLYAELTDDELSAAVTDGELTLVVGPAGQNGDPDPYIGEYDYSGFETGLKYSDMSEATQANVTALMQVYVYNLETPFADVWWESIMESIDDTYFVWIGDGDTSASTYPVFYYRIYNPSVWIEYNVESNAGPGVDDGNHGHNITRIPYTVNGGDYGIFANAINGNGPSTLLEHYVMVEHHAESDFNFDYTIEGDVDNDHDHDHGHSHNS